MAARKAPATPSTPSPAPQLAAKSTARGRASKAAASTAAPAEASETPKRSKAARAAPPQTVTLKQLAAQLAELVGLVVEHLKAGDRLRLQDLGVLEVRHRPARRPQPGNRREHPDRGEQEEAFRPAKELKEAV